DWIAEIAPNEWALDDALSAALRSSKVGPSERYNIEKQRLAVAERSVRSPGSEDRKYGLFNVDRLRSLVVQAAIEAGDISGARREFEKIRPENRRGIALATNEIALAEASGQLEELIARYRKAPESAPDVQALRRAAEYLKNHNRTEASQTVLEFMYER